MRDREMGRQKEPKTKTAGFYNVTSEVTYHHFCSILLVTKTDTADFPGGKVVKNPLPMERTQVPFSAQEDSTCLEQLSQ